MASKRNRRFVSQAALEALVRFGPELSGLRELQRTANSTFRTGVHQAQATSAGIRAAVAQARPELAKVYDQAGLDQARIAHTLIGSDLAGLGSDADRFKAAAATETAGGLGRLSEARTNALTDLSQRGVRAKEGEQFQIEQARSQFVNDITRILQRKQDLRREKGAFQSATVNDLAQAEADRQLKISEGAKDRKNARLTAGVDASGKVIPGGKADKPGSKGAARLPGGAKLLSQSDHKTLHSQVSDAMDEAGDFVRGAIKNHKSRAWINKQLAAGITGYTVHDPQTGRLKINPDGSPQTAPGLKKVPEIERNILLDQIFYGGISHATASKLHHLGYSVAHLGYKIASPDKIAKRRAMNALAGVVNTLG